MEKIKEYKGIIILILVVSAGVFYWYSYRPEQIRKDCYRAVLQTSDFDLNYVSCLRSKGFEK